ncbi:hypothetical protein DPMN_158681 [Dreissena polymorpha]|uniref:Uncharacterized protein n=1 Tax=Dreissena polymorpha TaxID=45954 RepID=A0A9D4EMX3_DREPO|nr:hypothetical protein DPMN_158681 [Dreissena polymorpha]
MTSSNTPPSPTTPPPRTPHPQRQLHRHHGPHIPTSPTTPPPRTPHPQRTLTPPTHVSATNNDCASVLKCTA